MILPPPLLAVAHGSREPEAAVATEALVAAVRRRLPQVEVALAYIDFGSPSFPAEHVRLPDAVIVPLLLSRGTHTTRDLPPEATSPLGPDPRLTGALLDRTREAGIAPAMPLVLAATGTLDRDGRADVREQARLVQAAWGAPVRAGFVTAAEPTVEQARCAVLAEHGAVAVVGYFLAPGRLPTTSGAVTDPLGDHPDVVELVVDRYRTGAATRYSEAQLPAPPTFSIMWE